MKSQQAFLLSIPLLICGFSATGCNRPKAPTVAPGTAVPVVTVAPAVVQDVPVYLDEIGKNAPYESVTVMPQAGGKIVERHFQDGANLKKGQLLFVIDPRPYEAQRDAAQASLAQAQATVELARIQFSRAEEVIGTRAIAKQDYDTKKSTVAIDEAEVLAAKAALETAKLNLAYCYIYSPIEGRAGARLVDVGNIVQANTSALLSIQRLDPIYANFTVTENDLSKVRKEMAGGRLKTLIRIPSDASDAARVGKLEFLDNTVQNGTGTVALRATVANQDHHFWPGQFVSIRLILATQRGAIVIPNQATQISQQGTFVYVVKQNKTVELRPVALGQRQGEGVVVQRGLTAGERVVVTGQMTLRPGGSVRIIQGDSSSAVGPAAGQVSQSASRLEGGRS